MSGRGNLTDPRTVSSQDLALLFMLPEPARGGRLDPGVGHCSLRSLSSDHLTDEVP